MDIDTFKDKDRMDKLVKYGLLKILDTCHKGADGIQLMHFNIELVTESNFRANNLDYKVSQCTASEGCKLSFKIDLRYKLIQKYNRVVYEGIKKAITSIKKLFTKVETEQKKEWA